MKIRLTFLFICFASIFYAQRRPLAPISNALLTEKHDPTFKNASAIIVLREVQHEVGKLLKVREVRKIYSNKGEVHSNFELPYSGVKIIKGTTFNWENGEVAASKLERESIFNSNSDNSEEKSTIIFPNVREGSVVELFYKIDRVGLSEIYYQGSLPIRKFKLEISNPLRIDLTISKNLFSNTEIDIHNKKKGLYYEANNVPALQREDFMGHYNNYRGRLFVEPLFGYKGKKVNNWGDVALYFDKAYWYGSDQNKRKTFSEWSRKDRRIKYRVDLIVEDEKDPLQIAKKIYSYVRDHIEWDQYYWEYNATTEEVLKNRRGSTGEISLLLHQMLNLAGIDAQLLVTARKDQGFIHFPTMDLFQNIMVHVKIAGESYLLDASQKYANFGELPLHFVNGDALILYGGREHQLITTQVQRKSKSTIRMDVTLDLEKLKIQGTFKNRISGYYAWSFREDYEDDTATFDTFQRDIEDANPTISIQGLKIKEYANVDKPISTFYDFELSDYVGSIDEDYFFNPLLHLGIKENPLLEEQRTYPLDFGFPYAQSLTITYDIPEGYKIKSMPPPKEVRVEDKIASLFFKCKSTKTQIEVSLDIYFNSALIPTSYYAEIRELFSAHFSSSNSQIVLTKR